MIEFLIPQYLHEAIRSDTERVQYQKVNESDCQTLSWSDNLFQVTSEISDIIGRSTRQANRHRQETSTISRLMPQVRRDQ
jgi:hypothetical protein